MVSFNPKTENWLQKGETPNIAFQEAWNDRELERKKAWDVSQGDFAKMQEYINSQQLLEQIAACVSALKEKDIKISGNAVDLAAGNLWATPQLLKAGASHVHCIEFSQHRLLELGPLVLQHYGVRSEQVTLVLGSFYDLKLPNASQGLVFMSQAFHHAEDPKRLLKEIRRVLRPDGVVIIIGEHFFKTWRVYAKYYLRQIRQLASLRLPVIFPTDKELMPPDLTLGDHYYCTYRYIQLFKEAGFKVEVQLGFKETLQQSFVLKVL